MSDARALASSHHPLPTSLPQARALALVGRYDEAEPHFDAAQGDAERRLQAATAADQREYWLEVRSPRGARP
jgi:hypothetical protein